MATITGNDYDNSLYGTQYNDYIYGLGGNDFLYGLGGNDFLDGGSGADTMDGGDQDDTYIVDNIGDVTVEAFNDKLGGVDTVNAYASHTIGFGIENLTLMGYDHIDGYGNDNSNVITGNDGNNSLLGYGGDDNIYGAGGDDFLDGWTGNDYLDGWTGNDTLLGWTGDDTLYGYSGNDYLGGEEGNDYLFGESGNDELSGGLGNDYLDGGYGKDYLTGGNGADIFNFNYVSDSPVGPGHDVITDFKWWEGDKIDLSTIDANVNWWMSGDQAFGADQLSYDVYTGILVADVIGGEDLQIELVGASGFDPILDVIA